MLDYLKFDKNPKTISLDPKPLSNGVQQHRSLPKIYECPTKREKLDRPCEKKKVLRKNRALEKLRASGVNIEKVSTE